MKLKTDSIDNMRDIPGMVFELPREISNTVHFDRPSGWVEYTLRVGKMQLAPDLNAEVSLSKYERRHASGLRERISELFGSGPQTREAYHYRVRCDIVDSEGSVKTGVFLATTIQDAVSDHAHEIGVRLDEPLVQMLCEPIEQILAAYTKHLNGREKR